ncbi:MAG TPA: MFS transporter [Candidatus Aphodovivens excrementavium]|nr:MFS transporter [Candidatus Aphodovivens excrementavium]
MKNRYLMFFVMYFCAATLALSQFKIVPILGPITEHLGIAYEQVSWLMSVFTVAGIVLAIPAGGLIAKYGPKKVWAIVMVIMVCGNVIGAVGIDSYAVLLVSRILEGCAFAFVAIAGVVFVNIWFPNKNTGLFVGIFMTFISIGSIVALNCMIPLTAAYGLASAWWVTAIVSAAMTAVFLFVVGEAPMSDAGGGEASKPSLAPILKNKRVMMICFLALTLGFVLYFFLNNYPSLFMTVYDVDAAGATFYSSLNNLFSIPFCILGGFIVDRLGLKGTPILLAASAVCVIVACAFMTRLTPSLFVVHTLVIAAFPGLMYTACNYLVPRDVDNPMQISYGIALMTLFYSVGIFIGCPIVLYAIAGTGSWETGGYVLAAVMAIGLAFILAYMAISKKPEKTTQE